MEIRDLTKLPDFALLNTKEVEFLLGCSKNSFKSICPDLKPRAIKNYSRLKWKFSDVKKAIQTLDVDRYY
jgi:hypothetical protein